MAVPPWLASFAKSHGSEQSNFKKKVAVVFK